MGQDSMGPRDNDGRILLGWWWATEAPFREELFAIARRLMDDHAMTYDERRDIAARINYICKTCMLEADAALHHWDSKAEAEAKK